MMRLEASARQRLDYSRRMLSAVGGTRDSATIKSERDFHFATRGDFLVSKVERLVCCAAQ
jgi:hypothetical protein